MMKCIKYFILGHRYNEKLTACASKHKHHILCSMNLFVTRISYSSHYIPHKIFYTVIHTSNTASNLHLIVPRNISFEKGKTIVQHP